MIRFSRPDATQPQGLVGLGEVAGWVDQIHVDLDDRRPLDGPAFAKASGPQLIVFRRAVFDLDFVTHGSSVAHRPDGVNLRVGAFSTPRQRAETAIPTRLIAPRTKPDGSGTALARAALGDNTCRLPSRSAAADERPSGTNPAERPPKSRQAFPRPGIAGRADVEAIESRRERVRGCHLGI